MASLYHINHDGAHDGQQRSLEDFQFDLENVLTMSQLVGKSAEERNAISVMLDIFAGTKNKTAAEVAVEIVTDAPKLSGHKSAARGACGKHCQNGAWAGARLREKFGRDSVATSLTEVFRYSWPNECRSKTCDVSGSRRSRSFHIGH